MYMISGLPGTEARWTIEQQKAREVEDARLSTEADGPWEERGPIGVEHLGVLIDRATHLHSMTDYPCRLPDGRMGRVAMREIDGEWEAVCVL
jgi:hypothetical protein